MSESPISLRDETGIERFRGTQSPGGGSQPGTVQIADVLFNEPDAAVPYPIIAVNQGTPSVTIAGDHVAGFPPNTLGNNPSFHITGSTGNDGDYSVVSAALIGGNTVIEVLEPLADATFDGDVSQSLTATLAIPAGSVLDVHLIPDAAPWADAAYITIGDSTDPEAYYSCDGDPFSNGPYDPKAVAHGINFVNMAYGAQAYGVNGGGEGAMIFGSVAVQSGGGVPYPAGATLSMVVSGINAGGGGGSVRVRVYYVTAVTPTVAA